MFHVKTTEWILVSDKLPPVVTRGHLSEYVFVTVADKFRYVDIDRYDHNTHGWEAHTTAITHWAALPPPAPITHAELERLGLA